MSGKPKATEKQYSPTWGGPGRGGSPPRRRRILKNDDVETVAIYRPGADNPMLFIFGGISIDPKTGVAIVTTNDGWRAVIGGKIKFHEEHKR